MADLLAAYGSIRIQPRREKERTKRHSANRQTPGLPPSRAPSYLIIVRSYSCGLLTQSLARSIYTSKTAVERKPAPLCSTNMMKPSCVLLLSSLILVATLAAAAASSSSPPYSVGKHPGWLLVLGRKGRELGQSSGYHYYQHQSKQPEVSSYSLSYISPRTCSTFIPLSAHQRLNHEPEGSIQQFGACLSSVDLHIGIGCIFLWVQLTCSATCRQRT